MKLKQSRLPLLLLSAPFLLFFFLPHTPATATGDLLYVETHPIINLTTEAADTPVADADAADAVDAAYGVNVAETIALTVGRAKDNPPKDCRLSSSICKVGEDQIVLEGCLVICKVANETPVFK